MRKKLFLCLCLALAGCGTGSQNPEVFLPKVRSPEGADLDQLRDRYCRGMNVDLQDKFLTPENFRAIFNCANYDSKLDGLRPLITNEKFPYFLKNMNLILRSESAGNLKESLRPWFEERSDGTSRVDRLLPILAKVIKNPSFQSGLPILQNLLEAGEGVWRELLPGLSAVVYQERFPNAYEDLSALFTRSRDEREKPVDYATAVKNWARFLKSDLDGETVAERGLELAARMREIEIPGTSVQEYLDQMNEKGVFVSLYLDSGAVRGEALNPKLNADPDEDELRDGLTLTPEERQERAYRKLFARPADGGEAPIVQLASLIAEFQGAHPDFLPALARWFSANGAKVTSGLTEYVVRARVVSNLSRLSIGDFLTDYSQETGKSPRRKVTGPEFAAFLHEAFSSASFQAWLEKELLVLNKEQFGPKNGEILRGSALVASVMSLYGLPEVAGFGESLVPGGKALPFSSASRRFSNLHRGDKLEIAFGGKTQNLEKHLTDAWWEAANATLGESVVLGFGMELAQTFFTQMASDFSARGQTISEWYYASPYSNPGTTEALAGYAVKELGLLPKYKKHKDYLKGAFAEEVFPREEDRRAFRLLVDQVPHIWLYLKSGMARSGNDLTRALASKDRGYLIRNYVGLLVAAYRTGWIRDGVRLIEAYQAQFPPGKTADVSDSLEDRRKVSKGADALKRLLRSLFEPGRKGDYSTSTLGQVLAPVSALVAPERREETERFLLVSADEILRTPNEKINDFLGGFSGTENEDPVLSRRETLRAVADLLRDPVFPDVVGELSGFFRDEAVQPALKFLAEKIDDGSLQESLLFLRRLLGFRA